jgi:hypothetical protein
MRTSYEYTTSGKAMGRLVKIKMGGKRNRWIATHFPLEKLLRDFK